MSEVNETDAKRIVDALGVKIDPALVSQLDKYLDTANDVTHTSPARGSVLVLLGDGTRVTATFIHGPGGITPSNKTGIGAFGGTTFPEETKLHVEGDNLKLYHQGHLAWTGTGGQTNLDGDYDITL